MEINKLLNATWQMQRTETAEMKNVPGKQISLSAETGQLSKISSKENKNSAYLFKKKKERTAAVKKQKNEKTICEPLLSCLLLACDAHGLLRQPRLLHTRGRVRVGVRVLQGQEGVGGDGALAFALGARQQVVDGQLRGGEGDGGNLGLQLLEVLLLLHQLVEGLLLLLLEEGGGGEAG